MIVFTIVFTLIAESGFNELSVTASASTYGDYEYNVLDNGTVEITSYKGSATEITIPSTIDGKSVASIGSGAFSDYSGLTSITIPDSVKSIGRFAFNNCSELISITIPDNVTRIGDYAFEGCSGLTSITIPDSVTRIGEGVINKTSWYNSNPNGVLYKDGWCLGYKGTIPNNTSVLIKEGTKGIADYAFYCCEGLTSITIPAGVSSIGCRIFYGCEGLTSITILDGVTNIGDGAFMDCSGVTTISIPDSVTSIGSNALGYYLYMDEDLQKVSNFKIYCNKGTAAEDYAIKNGFRYSSMPVPTPKAESTAIKPTKVVLSEKRVTLGVNETYIIITTITPTNANRDTIITFNSSKPEIAKVDDKTGKITALKSGTSTIIAKTANGKEASINVIVKKAPTKITVSKKTVTLNNGKDYQITYSLPKGTASNNVTFTSSKKSVATVNSKGKITAKQKGTTTITVKTYNGKTEKITVKVE